MFEKWKQKRKKLGEWIEKESNRIMQQSDKIRLQKIKSRENIIRDLIKTTKKAPPSEDIIELLRDPDDPTSYPMGLSKGTIRASMAIIITVGFLLITMMMVFLLPLSLDIIFEMWKLLALVFTIVVGSYFYSRLKLNGGLFK